MRLFIASKAKVENYASIIDSFRDIIDAKWVEEENLHLTWVFLGEVNSALPFEMKLKRISNIDVNISAQGLGYFGKPPRVLFIKCENSHIREKVSEFESNGFDMSRFQAHITLCRIKHIHNFREFKNKIESLSTVSAQIDREISLFKSTLTPKGPIYTKIV